MFGALTQLTYKLPKLVEVAQTIGSESQLANASVEFLSAIKRILLVGLQMILAEESPVL